MGTNKKKTWKKSAVAAVVAVCALASSIPALSYRKPHAYVQGGTKDWSDKDVLVFAQEGEENPMEGAHMDFSQGDTVFACGDSNAYEVIDSIVRQGHQGQKQNVCAHSYVTGTIAEHEKHPDGSCTVITYEAQQCAKCGSVIRGDEVSSFTYKICPHMGAAGTDADKKADVLETVGAEPDNKADEAQSPASEIGVVNTDALKVRSAAARDAEVMTLLEKDAVVEIVAEENDFYKVLIRFGESKEALEGYVKKEYLNLFVYSEF